MTFLEATERLNRIEGFMASMYAINTILHRTLGKRFTNEYERLFIEWAEKELLRTRKQKGGGTHA